MSVLLCKMCGGNLEITEGMTTIKCPYCGTNQTLPKCNDEQRLRMYDRANHFRRSNDYDKAMAVYEQILNEDLADSEAYWSIVLCRYGIEYVEDPATHKRIPTVNRTQYTSILADEDYKAALRYADVVQAEIYKQEAAVIDLIQKGILLVSQKEAPYDIFICCKETDADGNRTKDSVLADELYYELIRNGFKVFWARITLQDKLGSAYEPYIFAALHSAKVMIVIGTKPDHFQAVWMKNEWSRYLSLIKNGERKMLIPAYRDMDPYYLPEEFSHLQALDMSRLGFVQNLLYGIGTIFRDGEPQRQADPLKRPEYISLPAVGRIEYQPLDDQKIRRTGWEAYGWKWAIALGILFVLLTLFINVRGLYRRLQINRQDTAEAVGQILENLPIYDPQQERDMNEEDDAPVFSGVLEEFVVSAFQCPAENVPDSQLGKIQQLVIDHNPQVWKIGYSFEAPAADMLKNKRVDIKEQFGESFVWYEVSFEEKLNLSCLRRFSNLKKLDVYTPVSASDIKGLPLESISAYFDDPRSAAEVLEHPENIKELGFNSGVDSLDGMESFENLETLFIGYSELDNIDQLIHLQKLKNLSLVCSESVTNLTVLERLSNLEKIYLDTEGLKTLEFVNKLKNLSTLWIYRANLRNLDELKNCSTLVSLSITYCLNIKDMSAVDDLTNLQELALEIPYGCNMPKLDQLTGLRKLTLDGMKDCSFLENMSDLTELHLKGCTLSKDIDLSKLSSLKVLSCNIDTIYSSHHTDIEAIKAFDMIECLDMHGSQTYDDISGIFQMPNLRELNISGMQCEINFDAVAENPKLEVLYMEDMYLYKNVWVEGGSFMTSVYYDEVVLDEHMDFVKKFSGLKELYIGKNNLTDLSFAKDLQALRILDISDNYITQLRPLAKLPFLQKVICPGNPLKKEKVLRDSVLIIEEAEIE